MSAQVLTFFVAGEEYGAPILGVREIVRFEPLTRVPTARPSIRGVMNLRGGVVPVMDLALEFGLPPAPVTPRTCVAVLELPLPGGEPVVAGLLIDTVGQVLDVDEARIQPPPAFGTRADAAHLRGMVPRENGFVLLLDPERVLKLAGSGAAPTAAAA